MLPRIVTPALSPWLYPSPWLCPRGPQTARKRQKRRCCALRQLPADNREKSYSRRLARPRSAAAVEGGPGGCAGAGTTSASRVPTQVTPKSRCCDPPDWPDRLVQPRMVPRGGIAQPIADAQFRQQDLRPIWINFDFLAELAHEDPQVLRVVDMRLPPHRLE
jgi:hypothetical protein